MAEYLQAFDQDEMLDASIRVNQLVRSLQGRKVEEGDWTALYCAVKNAPDPGWSNLPFRDYLHQGVGIEFKILGQKNPAARMGSSFMHPAATRRINFDASGSAEDAMGQVFAQWGAAIDQFERRVRMTSPNGSADLRWGVLLWAPDHSEFLYFEERLSKPDPAAHVARWHDGNHRGNPTRNLHIFDRHTREKRFSCTLPRNGAKLQPYFTVPTVEQGALLFRPEPHNSVPLFIRKPDMDSLLAFFPEIAPEDAVSRLIKDEVGRRAHLP